MPATTASSWRSWATSRWVKSKRFITFVLLISGSPSKDFAAGQQRRQDAGDRCLGRHRLFDRAVDDECKLVVARDGVGLDAERIEHRPHGAAHHGLAEIELPQCPTFRYKDERRNLR